MTQESFPHLRSQSEIAGMFSVTAALTLAQLSFLLTACTCLLWRTSSST